MKLAIIGAGYVGLVTGACFAEMGNDVILVDAQVSKVEAWSRGASPYTSRGWRTMSSAMSGTTA